MIEKKRVKIVQNQKVVLYCIFCGKRLIEDTNYGEKCPNCQQNTLVIDNNYTVQDNIINK